MSELGIMYSKGKKRELDNFNDWVSFVLDSDVLVIMQGYDEIGATHIFIQVLVMKFWNFNL